MIEMKLLLPALIVMVGILSACGGETIEEKLNRKISEAVSEASGTEVDVDNLKDAVKQATEKLENLDLNAMDDVEVINFRELKKLMPADAAGLARTKHIGETTGAMGFTFSKAEASYGDGDKRVDATFIDSGGAGSLLMGMAGFANLNVDKETEQGSERTLDIDGNQAYEKYANRNGRITSELSVLVNERFIVTLKGKGVDVDALMSTYRDFDLGSLPVKAE